MLESTVLVGLVAVADYLVYLALTSFFTLELAVIEGVLLLSTLVFVWILITCVLDFREEGNKRIQDRS